MKIRELILEYFNYMKVIGRSLFTLTRIKYSLNKFADFLESEGIEHIEDINLNVLSDYQQMLAFSFTAKGSLLNRSTQEKLLSVVKGFTRF